MFWGLQLNRANLLRFLGSIGVVRSWSAGTTGLTPSTPTTGDVVLAGTLDVDNGGTGAATSQAASQNLATAFSVATVAALAALTSRPATVTMQGIFAAGDGGGGEFDWFAGDSTTAVTGIIVNPSSGTAGRYKRRYSGRVDAKWIGVLTSRTAAQNATALAEFFNFCDGGAGYIAPGTISTNAVAITHAGGTDIVCDATLVNAASTALAADLLSFTGRALASSVGAVASST